MVEAYLEGANGSAIGVVWQVELQADLSGIPRHLHDSETYGETEEMTQPDKASKMRFQALNGVESL